MTAKRRIGSYFTNLSHVKRWTGGSWAPVRFGKRWTGTAWEQWWPLAGGDISSGPYNLDEATQSIGTVFNLTQTPQGL